MENKKRTIKLLLRELSLEELKEIRRDINEIIVWKEGKKNEPR